MPYHKLAGEERRRFKQNVIYTLEAILACGFSVERTVPFRRSAVLGYTAFEDTLLTATTLSSSPPLASPANVALTQAETADAGATVASIAAAASATRTPARLFAEAPPPSLFGFLQRPGSDHPSSAATGATATATTPPSSSASAHSHGDGPAPPADERSLFRPTSSVHLQVTSPAPPLPAERLASHAHHRASSSMGMPNVDLLVAAAAVAAAAADESNFSAPPSSIRQQVDQGASNCFVSLPGPLPAVSVMTTPCVCLSRFFFF